MRVGFVLRRHHDAAAAGVTHRGDRLLRAGQEMGAGHAVHHVQLAEPVGPRRGEPGLEAVAELEVEVAPQQGVEHLVAGDRRAGLGLELDQRGHDPRARVDQRHVEIEPHHQVAHRPDATGPIPPNISSSRTYVTANLEMFGCGGPRECHTPGVRSGHGQTP